MRRRHLLGAASAGLLLGACARRDQPITLGYLAPLSGRRADMGESGRNGALLAVEDINAAGGVNGRPLRLLVADDHSSAEHGAAAFQRLHQGGAVALIGPHSTRVAAAVMPLATEAGMPMLSPLIRTPSLAGRDDLLFRMNRSTPEIAQAYARHLVQRGQRRIGVLRELSDPDFANAWYLHLQQAVQALGGEITQHLSYTSGADTRFSDLVRGLQPLRCDALVLMAHAVDVARLCQQLRHQTVRLPVAAIDSAGSEHLLALGGRAVEGLTLQQPFDRSGQQPRYQQFARRHAERFDELPGLAAVLTYDAVSVLHQALLRQRPGVSLKQALLDPTPFQGLQQAIRFDRYGDTTRQGFVVTVRGGRFETVGPA